MADFVSSNDNAAEATGVFYYSDRIDFFEPLVDDASSTHVRETYAGNIY